MKLAVEVLSIYNKLGNKYLVLLPHTCFAHHIGNFYLTLKSEIVIVFSVLR